MKFDKNIAKAGFAIALFFLFLPVGIFAAEVLFLKDGRVIYGKIDGENDKVIRFREKGRAEAIEFKRDTVLRLLYNIEKIQTKYIYKKDRSFTRGYIVNEDRNAITVRRILDNPKEIIIQKKDIASISNQKIDNRKKYRFISHEKGESVSIEGEFTAWKSVPMEKKGGKWVKDIRIDILKKNDFIYRTVVDGKPGKTKIIKFKMKDGKLIEDVDFVKFTVGLRFGVGMYNTGFSKNLVVKQPALSLIFKTNFLMLWEKLAFQTEFSYLRHVPKKKITPSLLI